MAETILTGDYYIDPTSTPFEESGNLTVAGILTAKSGIWFGTNPLAPPLWIGYSSAEGMPATVTFSHGQEGAFVWRDNPVGGNRTKMLLDANNTLSLFGTTGAQANIVLNGGNGRITLAGTGSGIYSGEDPVFSFDSSGNMVFGSLRTLNISNNTQSTSSSTGALTVAGGLGVAKDSYINGVRFGRGTGDDQDSIVIGREALSSNFGGYLNIAIGSYALHSNTTGAHNMAIGESALRSNTEGGANVAVGNHALYNNTTGVWNVALGGSALASNQNGQANTAVGVFSLQDNTTGTYNAALGTGAAQHNSTGGGNTSIGYAAMMYNTTGYANTAMGMVSMHQNAEGIKNTSIGNHAAYHLNGGNRNIMIGFSAGTSHADGVTPLVTPENSIYIGTGARGHSETDFNSIVIGTDAIGEGENTTVIGNTLTTRAKIHGELTATEGLKVEGETTLNGKVTIAEPQGDISMGIYQ